MSGRCCRTRRRFCRKSCQAALHGCLPAEHPGKGHLEITPETNPFRHPGVPEWRPDVCLPRVPGTMARPRIGESHGSRKTRRKTPRAPRSEEHTSELQSLAYLVCRLLLEKKKKNTQ